MTKFEYCSMVTSMIELTNNKTRVYFPNGDIKETIESIVDILNHLGKEDWELVSAIYSNPIQIIYLKREAREN